MTKLHAPSAGIDVSFVDQAVKRIGTQREAVIPLLQAIQEHYRYLPEEALRRVCDLTQITPARIAGVASFYTQFRHKPMGEHLVRVCHGTACHVRGADLIHDALRHHMHLPADGKQDTSTDGKFTVESVACLGCCTLAPVVQIDKATYGHLTPDQVPQAIRDFLEQDSLPSNGAAQSTENNHGNGRLAGALAQAEIRVGLGSCCMVKGSDRIYHTMRDTVRRMGIPVTVKRVGCVGMCHQTPIVEVVLPGREPVRYAQVQPDQADSIIHKHFKPHGLHRRLTGLLDSALEGLFTGGDGATIARHPLDVRDPPVSAFLDPQVRIATEHFGEMDPLDYDEYLAHDGFVALASALGVPVPTPGPPCPKSDGPKPQIVNLTSQISDLKPRPPQDLIEEMKAAGLRGRGGAGFPTGVKWGHVRAAPSVRAGSVSDRSPSTTPDAVSLPASLSGDGKYVICNGDEGDPGAFMDRMLLESFPYRIIEGLAIAAYAVGAHEGIFYIRAEYPLAVLRVRHAIRVCEEKGVLGASVLGSGFKLHVEVKEGAGAFVCGEETALIASLEGNRGTPRLRPPYPAQSGLWGKPTLVNNVETLSMVPWIMRHGAAAFAAYGTKTSKGTKVFALAGKVARGGLIEVPMGITIRQIVEHIGGGVISKVQSSKFKVKSSQDPDSHNIEPSTVNLEPSFKAVQIGGPSGGCIPAELGDTPVDYEALASLGAIMGSGGLIVLDHSDCMVDIARYFLSFTQDQSCGQCTFCRVGTRRMLDILNRLCDGKGRKDDLAELEQLSHLVQGGSLCGLGKTAPNPVLTTLKYFRSEYEAHLQGRCPAGRCKALIKYSVTDACIGCTLCAQHCPADAIPFTPYQKHSIDMTKCTRCDTCRGVCPVADAAGNPHGGAILVE